MGLGTLGFALYLVLFVALQLVVGRASLDAPDSDVSLRRETDTIVDVSQSPLTFTSIEVGVESACALTETGRVVCWDIAEDRRWRVDLPVRSYVSLQGGWHGFCAFTESGEMDCWSEGGEPAPWFRDQAELATGRQRLRAIAIGSENSGYSCVLTILGEAVCWGERAVHWPPPPDGPFAALTPPSYLWAQGSGYGSVCGLRTNGTAVCWGSRGSEDERQVIEEYSGPFTAIKGTIGGLCGLTTDGVWTCLSRHQSSDRRFIAMGTGGMHDCAITPSGISYCEPATSLRLLFSHGRKRMTPPDPSPDRFVSITSGAATANDDAYACALTATGRAYCWRNEDNKLERPQPPERGYLRVSDGYGHTCGLTADSGIDCWGWNNFGQADAPDGQFKAVSAGYSASCAVTLKGHLVCWGSISTDHTGHPGILPEAVYQSVAVGYDGLCALTVDGHVECKSPDYSSQSQQTLGSPFMAVGLGWDGQICVLTNGGEALCWDSSNVTSTPEVRRDGLSTISVGHSRAGCGLTQIGKIACWTDTDAADLRLPDREYESLSVGTGGGCAISAAGEITCWGRMIPRSFPSIGRADESSHERFTAVSVSNHRGCALTWNGELHCWGDVEYERFPSNEPYGWFSSR